MINIEGQDKTVLTTWRSDIDKDMLLKGCAIDCTLLLGYRILEAYDYSV
jgi:hypothetical protein